MSYCIICGKAVKPINGILFHVELDSSHLPVLTGDNRPGEMWVTPDVFLRFDLTDGWFGLIDKDNLGYDEMGAVLMRLADIDALIVALGKLREEVRDAPAIDGAVVRSDRI